MGEKGEWKREVREWKKREGRILRESYKGGREEGKSRTMETVVMEEREGK